jgi:hypothetical protein
MAYDNELKFALFKNDKGDNLKRPDYRGEVTVKGVAYKLSGWIADMKNGTKYIRGVVEFDEKKNGATPAPRQSQPPSDPSKSAYDKPAQSNHGADSDVPF